MAKLRAEQHMSGVLLIGIGLLALAQLIWPSYFIWGATNMGATLLMLLGGAIGAGSLAWHLEVRGGNGVFYLWLLSTVERGIVFRNEAGPESESEKQNAERVAYAQWERAGRPIRTQEAKDEEYRRALDVVRHNGYEIVPEEKHLIGDTAAAGEPIRTEIQSSQVIK
jgi:hypothetical protein